MNKQFAKTKLVRIDSKLHKLLKVKAAKECKSVKICLEECFKEYSNPQKPPVGNKEASI